MFVTHFAQINLFSAPKVITLDFECPEENPYNLFPTCAKCVPFPNKNVIVDSLTLHMPVIDVCDAVNKCVKCSLNEDGSAIIIKKPKVPSLSVDMVKDIHSLEGTDACAVTWLNHSKERTAIC